jgi:hypothetical protein
MSLLSVFGYGLWAIALIPLVGFAISLYKGLKQWKSGSTYNEDTGFGPLIKHDSTERVAFL